MYSTVSYQRPYRHVFQRFVSADCQMSSAHLPQISRYACRSISVIFIPCVVIAHTIRSPSVLKLLKCFKTVHTCRESTDARSVNLQGIRWLAHSIVALENHHIGRHLAPVFAQNYKIVDSSRKTSNSVRLWNFDTYTNLPNERLHWLRDISFTALHCSLHVTTVLIKLIKKWPSCVLVDLWHVFWSTNRNSAKVIRTKGATLLTLRVGQFVTRMLTHTADCAILQCIFDAI